MNFLLVETGLNTRREFFAFNYLTYTPPKIKPAEPFAFIQRKYL